MEADSTPQREVSPGNSRPVTLSDSLISLEFFHLKLCSFLTNKIKKKPGRGFIFFRLKEELVIVSPHLLKP